MTDISVYTLKPFPWSRNGTKEEFANAGDTFDLPERLFGGLNAEGYVRRAVIGDGHFNLNPAPAVSGPAEPVAPAAAEGIAAGEASLNQVRAESGLAPISHAPQPPAKTADLSEDEAAAIADGSWKTLKFFAKRSIAAKLSDSAIKDGADADAAIEAYIASKG